MARAVGSDLFRTLFPSQVAACYHRCRQLALDRDVMLEIHLKIRSPELAVIPWELAFDPEHGEFLSLSGQVSLVRHPIEMGTIRRVPVVHPLRMLVIISTPLDVTPLDVAAEQSFIDEALKELTASRQIELHWLRDEVTWFELRETLRHGPWHVVHYIGHAKFFHEWNEGGVLLSDEEGYSAPLSASDLAHLLTLDGNPPQLVVLNACEGAKGTPEDDATSIASTLVRRGIAAAVAMRVAVPDRAAVALSRSFYTAVSNGSTLLQAVADARFAIKQAKPRSCLWSALALYLHGTDSRLFEPAAHDEHYRDETEPALATMIPRLKPDSGAYHCMVSYSSRDRDFALALVGRLEGFGFRVFIDRRDIQPGDRIAKRIERAIQQSSSAIVIVNEHWERSSWCQEEAAALRTRAQSSPEFRIIPVCIEPCSPTPSWAGRVHVSFARGEQPGGQKLLELVYGILGQRPPSEGSNEAQAMMRQTAAVDVFSTELRAATTETRIVQLWESRQARGISEEAAALPAAEVLISMGRAELALRILESAGEGLRAQQLRALAYARTDRLDRALEILRILREKGVTLDTETGGLLAGRYKQRWQKSDDWGALESAYYIYLETFELTRDPYPAINVAACELYRGNPDAASRRAREVLELIRIAHAPGAHWTYATLGEAYLLCGDLENSLLWYRKAVAEASTRFGDIAVMRRQVQLNLRLLEQQGCLKPGSDALLKILPVPGVAAFVGHLIDLSGRDKPRFPPEKLKLVRLALRERLKKHRVGVGCSSAARGGDILFIEALIERAGRARVFLPFPADAFKMTSVGYGWDERFERLISSGEAAVQLNVLRDDVPPEGERAAAFAACWKEAMHAAEQHAKQLDAELLLLALWDQHRGDGRGGTEDAVSYWRANLDAPIEIIDIGNL